MTAEKNLYRSGGRSAGQPENVTDHEQTLDQFRPVPFYFLDTCDPADYTAEAVSEAMERMKELGYGGIVLFNKPPMGFCYS